MEVTLLESLLANFTGIFFRGNKASYQPEGAHAGKIYFAEDTQELLVDNVSYGGSGISDVTLDGTTLKITTSTGVKTVDIADIIKYSTTISDDLEMPNAVGGIAKGTTAGDLKTKTFTQLFDDLLFPTIQPIGTQPSVKFGVKSSQIEVGAALPQELDDFDYSFTRGVWRLNGAIVPGKYYSGTAGTPTIKCNHPTANSNPPASVDTDKTITYTLSVTVAAGDTTVDNKGNAATVQPYSGGTLTKPANINIYYPYYSNAANNATVAKGGLLSSTTVADLNFAKATDSTTFIFKLPNKYTLTSIIPYNPNSGKYNSDDEEISSWIKTTESISVNSVETEYAVYTKNGTAHASNKFKFTFTK